MMDLATAHAVNVETDVPIPMRDGVVLVADVYRPTGPGPFPVLVMRTPYGKSLDGTRPERELFPLHGYVVVVQDTRGRFASGGDFYPFFDEGRDGYDTVEWAAVQPWSNGQVGMVGQSYLALAQYLAAKERPPSLKAICPVSGPVSHLDNCVYRGGALELGWMLTYFLSLAQSTLERKGLWDEYRTRIEALLAKPEVPGSLPNMDAYRRLPLQALADELGEGASYFADILNHPSADGFWMPVDVNSAVSELDIPMFHIGSWYDAFQYDTLHIFSRMRAAAKSPEARVGQRLLMGPWGHLIPFSTPTSRGAGDIDFGEAAKVELLLLQLQWLDGVFGRGGALEAAPVRIFVMGRNEWRDEQEWPLARTRYMPLFLHGGGAANTVDGDGVLSFDPPEDEPADAFTYDPHDPVPTRGGAGLARALGAYDQRKVEGRQDVLVYTSAPLEAELEVTGPVSVELFAASSAPDTDFTAKLVDVRPDGYAQNIVDGIIRARFRDSRAEPVLMRPGETYRFIVDLWSTSHVFKAGHRLRLEVSSSNFPRYDRNLNSGRDAATDDRPEIARQTIFHDRTRPSRVILPVIPA